LLSLNNTGPNANKSQECGGSDNGQYGFCKQWQQAKGFCIIDPEKLLILADNVFTGYEYVYQQYEFFEDGKGKGTKNTYEKYFRLWYNFELVPGAKKIRVTLTQCEEGITSDKGLHYFSQQPSQAISGGDAKVSLQRANTCTPIYQPGSYTLTNGKFVWSGN
jgi:hypothetical protein